MADFYGDDFVATINSVPRPNQAWIADLACIWTHEDWQRHTVALDLVNRDIVGWPITPRTMANIVIDTLTMAWFRRKPEPGLLRHYDSGSRYAKHGFKNMLMLQFLRNWTSALREGKLVA